MTRLARRRQVVQELLRSPEPSLRWRTRVGVLGEGRDDRAARRLQGEVRRSKRVRGLMQREGARPHRDAVATIYHKWQGTHWVLAALADLGYPSGEARLLPLRDRVLELWLRPSFQRSIEVDSRSGAYGVTNAVPVLAGRARRCASQQGNALRYLSMLGLEDERLKELAELLLRWQWPDGGWNCDRDPHADTSSFMETLLPMRGLAQFARATGDRAARETARRASEVFLERQMYRRRTNGAVMAPDFTRLHFPIYWHYDILAGLRGLAELGPIRDPRAEAALDWLEERELPEGGWPAERAYYRCGTEFRPSGEYVSWGPHGRTRANDWATTDALTVLSSAGRFSA